MADADFLPDFSFLRRSNEATREEYGRFQQHLILLDDHTRMAFFYRALRSIAPSGVVVDVGAGTGILALMALKLGFEYAILIEPSRKISTYARHLMEVNDVPSNRFSHNRKRARKRYVWRSSDPDKPNPH